MDKSNIRKSQPTLSNYFMLIKISQYFIIKLKYKITKHNKNMSFIIYFTLFIYFIFNLFSFFYYKSLIYDLFYLYLKSF